MSSHTTTGASVTESTPPRHPRALEPATLIITILLSVGGAVIGLHLVTTLGISANTSVIGALVAMVMGRLSFLGLSRFRSIHRQNLAQSSISGATFAAANSLLTPIAIPFAIGRPDLVWPMLIGASFALLVDGFILYRAFGSEFLPATAAWPPGVAAAETIKAGDRGGRRALVLAGGAAVGVGASFFGLPMSAFGVAFLGNVWALSMFAVGLITNQIVPATTGISLSAAFIPHGVMIGAGLIALFQAARILLSKRTEKLAEDVEGTADPSLASTVSRRTLRAVLRNGFALYLGGAVLIAVVGGLWTELTWYALIGWVLFAAVAAIVHELIVGLAAMHSGWFPAFAVTLIFMVIGLLIGIPVVPLAMLTGYCAATGPAFADMGYDLKAGWILRRGERPYTRFELDGRKQQFISSVIGFLVAIAMVAILWQPFFANAQIPPVSKVFADTITQGLADPGIWLTLALWAIPGALIQLIGGAKRQMGVMLATGLLIATPWAGVLVVLGLIARVVWEKWRGEKGHNEVVLFGAGIIAGDAVWGTAQVFK
ncbi:OPT/YSL family transporter [Microbacterium sp.]|uniref:OPT/YSL family transporter n=1 Tax=Microbacterium sp. TaxID=51671 RepID=UPI002810CBF2|nr:OPT/YSL family transporter [Microbacterium sp.]